MKHVAVGIIVKNGDVLACQRKRDARYALKWEFPGGKVEAGESARQALVRELQEELAIEAVVDREFFRQEWVYPESQTGNHRDGAFDVTYFLVSSFNGTLVNNAFEQIQWTTPASLLGMDILEGNRAAVELLVHHVQKSQEAKSH
jgi:8-oxo-dGTP diphosphatase